MRVLICGSRNWRDRDLIKQVVGALPVGSTVITGGAPGADTIAMQEARLRGLGQQVFRADWVRYGKAAGPIRNQEMLDEGRPDLVIAFRLEGKSRGTDDMIRRAKSAGVPVEVFTRTVSDDLDIRMHKAIEQLLSVEGEAS